MKPAYDSVYAPRMWWRCVKKDLARLGLIPMEIEHCVWALYQQEHGHPRLIGEILVHVDDHLSAGDETSAE